MNAVFILLLTVTIANLILAFLVLWHQRWAEVNRVFALTALAVAGWTFTNAVFQSTASVTTATQAAAFSYLSAVTLGASFLHFAWIFTRRSSIPSRGKTVLWILAVLIGFLPFVPGTVIQSVDLSSARSIITSAGVYAIAVFIIVTSAWAFGTLVRGYQDLRGVARDQTHYVLTGAALTASIGLICNLLLPLLGNYSVVWLGPTSSLFFVGLTVYAIVAHHLFDIRIIIKRTVVYGSLLAGISAGYTVVEQLLTETLRHSAHGAESTWFANVGGAIVVSFCVAPVRQWLEEHLDDLIFGREKKHRRHDLSK